VPVVVYSWVKASLPRLVDVLVDVMRPRKLLYRRHRFLMGHLGSSRGEVFISLRRTKNNNSQL